MSTAQTLATRVSVVRIVLDNGRQPDQMTPRQIVDVLGTALVKPYDSETGERAD
jgi:hypothetical protein